MSRLDEVYSRDLEKEVDKARSLGRFDLSEYLSLRASNDAIREKGVEWLFTALSDIAEAFNGRGASIQIAKIDGHRFKFGNSRLTGSAITLNRGIRQLTVEAGWTQSTGDGIMRGGALVCARITHFGFTKQNEELLLLKVEGIPQWFSRMGERELASFNITSFKRHFETFLG